MTRPKTFRGLFIFLGLTILFSSVFWALSIFLQGTRLYITGLMWSPGIAALIACKMSGRPIASLGWRWNETRYQIQGYLIPFGYALIAYLFVWLAGFGIFYDTGTVDRIVAGFGWEGLPGGWAVFFYVLIMASAGLPSYIATALGEEIGWRGYLVPVLAERWSFARVALVSGVVWAVWHYPLILFGGYNGGNNVVLALICFTVMIIAISFPMAWLRIKSGSLWTAAIFHAAHNLFIQGVFTPLTRDTGNTAFYIDEFGVVLPIVAILFAVYTFRRHGKPPLTV